jgi:hypothetical protein
MYLQPGPSAVTAPNPTVRSSLGEYKSTWLFLVVAPEVVLDPGRIEKRADTIVTNRCCVVGAILRGPYCCA